MVNFNIINCLGVACAVIFALIAMGSGIASVVMTIEYTEIVPCQNSNFHGCWGTSQP